MNAAEAHAVPTSVIPPNAVDRATMSGCRHAASFHCSERPHQTTNSLFRAGIRTGRTLNPFLAGTPDGDDVSLVSLCEHHQLTIARPRPAGELERDGSRHVGKVAEAARGRVEEPDSDLRPAELVGGIRKRESDCSVPETAASSVPPGHRSGWGSAAARSHCCIDPSA